MQHDWPLTMPWLDESKRAWRSMRAFVDARIMPASGSGTVGASVLVGMLGNPPKP